MLAAEKPLALLEYVRQSQQQCNSYQTLEEVMEIDTVAEYGIGNIIDKLNCIVNAVTEAVIGTDLAKPWEKLVNDIRKYIDNIKACKDEPTDLGQAK